MPPNIPDRKWLIVIFAFALLAVFYLDTISENTQLFAMAQRASHAFLPLTSHL